MHCTTPVWNAQPLFSAARTMAFVTARSGTAGNSTGAYSFVVPSMRTAPVAITMSPLFTSVCMPPQVPMRMKVFAPHFTSSSMAMEAEGPPMPVEVTETFTPSRVPVQVSNSRLSATSSAPSRYCAIFLQRLGSPGRITYSPTSQGAV